MFFLRCEYVSVHVLNMCIYLSHHFNRRKYKEIYVYDMYIFQIPYNIFQFLASNFLAPFYGNIINPIFPQGRQGANAEFEVPFVVRCDFDFHLADENAQKSLVQGCFNTPFGTHTL